MNIITARRWLFKGMLCSGLFFYANAQAAEALPVKQPDGLCSSCFRPVLNEIHYQTSAEKWVNASTAEITVSVNAALNETQLTKAHALITEKLNQIAQGPWQIIQFDRMPNDSGLEQLNIRAQVRLPEGALSGIREKAKKISQPGETFQVESLLFQPTLGEIIMAQKQLRDQIYQQIQVELSTLNTLYPSQSYTIHSLRFYDNNRLTPPQAASPHLLLAKTADANASLPPEASAPIANKLQLNAEVVLAALHH